MVIKANKALTVNDRRQALTVEQKRDLLSGRQRQASQVKIN